MLNSPGFSYDYRRLHEKPDRRHWTTTRSWHGLRRSDVDQHPEYGGSWPIPHHPAGTGCDGRSAGDARLDSWSHPLPLRWPGVGRAWFDATPLRWSLPLPSAGLWPKELGATDQLPPPLAVCLDRNGALPAEYGAAVPEYKVDQRRFHCDHDRCTGHVLLDHCERRYPFQ